MASSNKYCENTKSSSFPVIWYHGVSLHKQNLFMYLNAVMGCSILRGGTEGADFASSCCQYVSIRRSGG